MTSLVDKAREFAFRAHNAIGQRRKYVDRPYTDHLEAVADLVPSVTSDETMIAAAYLHDVVEDTPVTFDEVADHFGADVAYLVIYLTPVSRTKDGNRATRKAIDRAQIAKGDARVHTIKLADILDNISSIVERDPKFASVYLEEKRLLLPYLKDGNSELFSRVERLIDAWFNGEAMNG